MTSITFIILRLMLWFHNTLSRHSFILFLLVMNNDEADAIAAHTVEKHINFFHLCTENYHLNLSNLLPCWSSQLGVSEPLSSSLAQEPLLHCKSFNWDATVEIEVAGTHRDSYFNLILYTFNLQVNDYFRLLRLSTRHPSFNTITSVFVFRKVIVITAF